MKNSKLLTATAVFSVAITAAITTMSLTAAYRGDSNQNKFNQKPPQLSEEQHEAMIEALENKDYEAWLEIAPEDGRFSKVTEEKFEAFAEKKLAGILDMEEKKAEMEAKREALDEAFANADYEAWLEIMTEDNHNPQILEVINEDNFYKLIEIHNLKKEGMAKFEAAKEIADELGIEPMKKPGMHKGKGQDFGKGKHFNK